MRARDKLLSDGEKINRSVLKGPSYLVVTANRLLLSDLLAILFRFDVNGRTGFNSHHGCNFSSPYFQF